MSFNHADSAILFKQTLCFWTQNNFDVGYKETPFLKLTRIQSSVESNVICINGKIIGNFKVWKIMTMMGSKHHWTTSCRQTGVGESTLKEYNMVGASMGFGVQQLHSSPTSADYQLWASKQVSELHRGSVPCW